MTPEELTAELKQTVKVLDELRKRRDDLIRAHPGTLREVAEIAGLSHQRISQLKNEEQR